MTGPPIDSPDLRPCEFGWLADAGHCEPWSSGESHECDYGFFHPPGERDCVPVGAPCPADDFGPASPTEGTVHYVQSGGLGDGSRDAPLGTIAGALAISRPGDTILIGKGTYEEAPLHLTNGIKLAGACAAQTRFVATNIDINDASIALGAGEAGLMNISIAPSQNWGLHVHGSDARLHVRGVLIEGAEEVGVLVEADATLRATDFVVRRTTPSQEGTNGVGVAAITGAVQLERAVLADNRLAGLGGADAVVVLEATHIFGTMLGTDAVGVETSLGVTFTLGSLDIRGSVIESNGAGISGAAATVQIEQSLVRRHAGVLSQAATLGLTLRDGATGSLARTQFEDNAGASILLRAASLQADDLVVRGPSIAALDAAEGAAVEGARWLLEGSGIRVTDPGTVARVDMLTVRDTAPTGGGVGRAVSISGGALAHLQKARFENSTASGVTAMGAESTAELVDVAVVGTRPNAEGGEGWGVELFEGATASLRRVVVTRAKSGGFIVGKESTAVLEDAAFVDTEGRPDGQLGRGINVQLGSALTGERVFVQGAHQLGVYSVADSHVELGDLRVAGTLSAPCGPIRCEPSGGIAVGASLGASLAVSHFDVEGADLCGVLVDDAEVDLMDGIVRDAAIGACVQTADHSIERLTSDVAYVDNEINLDSTDLTVPDPTEQIAVP